jgi:Na+/proline symporter
MVAAAMSSLDSVLLVMASTAERDIAGLLGGSGAEGAELRKTRLWVALFALIAALIALRPPGGIVTLTVLSGAVFAACFAPSVLLGLYWRRGTGVAVLASFAGGLVTLLLWPRLPIAATVHQVFPAVFLSTVLYVLTAIRAPVVESPPLDRLFSSAGKD